MCQIHKQDDYLLVNKIDKLFTPDARKFAGNYLEYLAELLAQVDTAEVAEFIEQILQARARGATIYFIGNGGSAATASHFANDLAIGTRSWDEPFKVISLCDNAAVVTAIANDNGYDKIFLQQLQVLAQPGDLLVAISASGNSENIVKGIEYANANEMVTIGLTAFDGGALRKTAKYGVHIPTGKGEYGPAEDLHMVLDHLVGAYLMRYVTWRDATI